MTFLNPFVLVALVAAGIPLIIHLINFRKPRRVDFSSLAFLEELRQQTLRRLRIKQWLLLALRTLAIVCLVLAFARPTVNSPSIAGLSSARRSVVVVLDNSLSMDLRDQDGSYFGQAVDFVTSLSESLAPADELAIVPLVDDGLAHPLVRPSLAAGQLAEWSFAYGRAQFGSALSRTASVLDDASNPVTEVFVVSDLQRSSFVDSLGANLGRVSRMTVVPIGTRTFSNVALTDARVASSIIEVNQPVVVEATVRNFGSEPIANWGLSIYIEDERVAQSSVSLQPDEETTLSVSFTPAVRGWLRGRLSLEDDAFRYDNDRYFTVLVPEVRRILLVTGSGRVTDFVDLVLSTQLQDGKRLFDVREVGEGSVSGAFAGAYDAIVLVGVRQMTAGLVSALSSFVEEGGGVMVFAGEEAAAGAYATLLESLSAGSLSGLAEATAGGTLTALDNLDIEHPLFRSVFDDVGTSGETVERPTLSRLVRYRPGSGDEQTILSTTIGLPMLQEVRHGEGRVLIAPFLPEPDWTDLPVRGLFVPLLFRSMYYLTTRIDNLDPGSGDSRETAFRVAAASTGQLRILSRAGQEWIPEQRSSGRGLFFSLPPTLQEPGLYDVMDGDRLLQRFAVNVDAEESDLERLGPDQASAALNGMSGLSPVVMNLASNAASMADRIRRQETGVEIWNVFLAVALVLLVAEMFVAARWRPAVSAGTTA